MPPESSFAIRLKMQTICGKQLFRENLWIVWDALHGGQRHGLVHLSTLTQILIFDYACQSVCVALTDRPQT